MVQWVVHCKSRLDVYWFLESVLERGAVEWDTDSEIVKWAEWYVTRCKCSMRTVSYVLRLYASTT